MSEFVNLHAHSEFSSLDGLGKVHNILWAAYNKGNAGHAITDHGTCASAFEVLKVSEEIRKETGLDFRGIPGIEAYFVPDRKFQPRGRKEIREDLKLIESVGALNSEQIKEYIEANYKKEHNYWHLTLLVKNEEGLRNLFRLTWYSNQKDACRAVGSGRQMPRIDWNLLEQHHEGLICTSACLRGPVSEPALAGNKDLAWTNAERLKAIFRDDFYVEIMPLEMQRQAEANYHCLDFADGLNLPVIATNDCHWVKPDDYETHTVLCAVQSHSKMSEPTLDEGGSRFCLSEKSLYIKNRQEMWISFKNYHNDYIGGRFADQAIDRTLEVLDKCRLIMPQIRTRLPEFKIPDDPDFLRWREFSQNNAIERGIQEHTCQSSIK